MYLNPLQLDVASCWDLAGRYLGAMVGAMIIFAVWVRLGPGAQERLRQARLHKGATALILFLVWFGVVYASNKAHTNNPPVNPPGNINAEIRLYWDSARERYVPVMLPLKKVDP